MFDGSDGRTTSGGMLMPTIDLAFVLKGSTKSAVEVLCGNRATHAAPLNSRTCTVTVAVAPAPEPAETDAVTE